MRTLRARIQHEFSEDVGVSRFGMIVTVFHRSAWVRFNGLTADMLMPMKLIELLSTEVAPALAEVVTELFEAWEAIKTAVVADGGGLDAFNEFLMRASRDERSVKARYDTAIMKYRYALRVQEMAHLSEIVDGLL